MKPNKFLTGRSGVYGIRNIVNHKIYVGKTHCMYKRCHQYVGDFKDNRSGRINSYLLNAITKSGIDNFEFFPLEFCDNSALSERELYWILNLKSTERNFGYNLRLDTTGGMIPNDETRRKITDSLRVQYEDGRRSGADHSKKMIENWKNNPGRAEQQSRILSNIKTKYEYVLYFSDGTSESCMYDRLKELDLHQSMSVFHRKKTNDVVFRNVRIVRHSRGEI